MAAGDLDGDGDQDLVIACSSDDKVLIQLAANGSFMGSSVQLVTTAPGALALAHVDGDASLDLLVASPTQGLVYPYASGSALTFTALTPVRAGVQPVALVVLDVDGNGTQDFVVVDRAGNAILMLAGNGSGLFVQGGIMLVSAAPADAALLAGPAGAVTLAVVYDTDPAALEQIAWAGTSVSVASFPWNPHSIRVAAARLDGDAQDDLVSIASTGSDVTTALVSPQGTTPQSVALPGVPVDLATGDLDGDGLAEAWVLSNDNMLRVNRARGGGLVEPWLSELVSVGASSLLVVDVNGDGRLDAVVGGTWGYEVLTGHCP